jgi:hypothetical protein
MRHLSICEEIAEMRPVLVVYAPWSVESRAVAQEVWGPSALEQLGELENGEKCRLLLGISRAECVTGRS